MAKSSGQKAKLLELARFLLRETDENHPAPLERILRHLESCGISAERKSLYADMEELRLQGLDVVYEKGKNGGYFIGGRAFELPEVRLLVDAVQSSRFLTEKKSTQLIEKLSGLVSRHEAKEIHRHVKVVGRIKTMNESIYRNVDAISRAMEEDRQIRFSYFEWTAEGEKKFRRGGATYTASPFHLIWDDENYYLIAFDGDKKEKRHFRVDKMARLRVTDTPREGGEMLAELDAAAYEKKNFGMYNGREEYVTLLVAEELAGIFYDRFGRLVTRRREGAFEVTVSVAVGPVFYGFLAAFGGGVEILSPASVREEYRALLQGALKGREREE